MKLFGQPAAEKILFKTKELLSRLKTTPSLHVIRVGEDEASVAYVRLKVRRAKEIGIKSVVHTLLDTAEEQTLLELINKLNIDPSVSGILVQLPFPKGSSINPQKIIEAINPKKDVDGLHPINVGHLWNGQKGLVPCTPAGIITLLDHYDIKLAGKDVAIINRSNLVGKPLAALLLKRDATVTIAHSKSKDIVEISKRADIVVVATGKPGTLTPKMVKTGAIIIDVGISKVDGVIKGDVSPEVSEIACAISPVPGGVGPLTVAHLLYNTVLTNVF